MPRGNGLDTTLLAEYQMHVDELARWLDVQLTQAPGMPGMMFVEFDRLEGPTIRSQSDYLVNLHELGHQALGHTQGRPGAEDKTYYFDNGVLRSEAEAWEWALDYCIDTVTDESRRYMWDVCLGSYYRAALSAGFETPGQRLWNGNRHHVSFAYGTPDVYFWSIVDRIKDEALALV